MRGAGSLSARFAAARTPALRSRGNTAATREIQSPRPLQTNVGDDARTAPAGAFRRPTGPQVRLLGRRSSRGVRGGVGFRGRGMPLPYMASGHDRPNGLAAAARANVGRDALIPPHPAAAGMFPVLNFNGAAGVNARPTDPGKPGGHPGKCNPRSHCKHPCRGRCSHRPGVFAAAQGSAGGINPAPTGKFCVPGKPSSHDVCPGLQGRATALPRGSAAGQAGPIWNRPLHGVFAAARGSAGGINPAPTNKFYALGHQNAPQQHAPLIPNS